MTQTDSRDARIEYLTAELNRLRIENDHLRLTYDPDGRRAEIEWLKEYIRIAIGGIDGLVRMTGCLTQEDFEAVKKTLEQVLEKAGE